MGKVEGRTQVFSFAELQNTMGGAKGLVGWSSNEQHGVELSCLKCNSDRGLATKHFGSFGRISGRQARNLWVGSVPPRGWFAAES
jgi:hypothetical protein